MSFRSFEFKNFTKTNELVAVIFSGGCPRNEITIPAEAMHPFVAPYPYEVTALIMRAPDGREFRCCAKAWSSWVPEIGAWGIQRIGSGAYGNGTVLCCPDLDSEGIIRERTAAGRENFNQSRY